jgi:protein ImuB
VAPLGADQLGLADADAPQPGQIDQLIDRLANRLGAPNVLRLTARDSHIPERAQRLAPAFEPAPPGAWLMGRPRPIRLLRYPDPIEATAPVPDSPPVMFRWRQLLYRVRHAEGPERIAAEWWRMPDWPLDTMPDAIRDYYRLEDEAGRRYWVYRKGFYRPDPPPTWFLHGFFA